MTDIRILSCPQCGFPKIRDCGNGLYQCDDCGIHFDKNENIVQTNEEWFCQLPTEEKATWLEEKMTWAAQEQGTFTAKGWEKWLKQPRKETTQGGVKNGRRNDL